MRRLKSKSGFSLVEVALAMAIAVFCLVVMMGLLPVGLTSNRASIGQTAANGILNEVVSDLRATTPTVPTGTTTSNQFKIAIPSSTSSGTVTTVYFTGQGVSTGTVLTPNALYKLTVSFMANTGAKTASVGIAKVTWPAASTTSTGTVESFVGLDRN
jgi:uncharacterized protein (TIGR02598 family)